jgi:hypothetical protein
MAYDCSLIFRNPSDIMSSIIAIGAAWFDVNATSFPSPCTAEFMLVGMISIPEKSEPELA